MPFRKSFDEVDAEELSGLVAVVYIMESGESVPRSELVSQIGGLNDVHAQRGGFIQERNGRVIASDYGKNLRDKYPGFFQVGD